MEIITENLSKNPKCPHGPTLLFSRIIEDKPSRFFACSACRNRKDCNFFLWESEKQSPQSIELWKNNNKKFVAGINHHNLYITFNKVLQLSSQQRMFCHDCSAFQLDRFKEKHKEHKFTEGISDYEMKHPSELLKPLDDAKKEAQYLFAKSSVEFIVGMLRKQKLTNVLCIGAPRIHEYISSNHDDMNSLLLDIDRRYMNFMSPMEFCWYNSFNHHFFLEESKEIFKEFLQDKGKNLVIVTDPPFGGRVEPLATSFKLINETYKSLNNLEEDVKIFWIFPYFMEPQIINHFPEFFMLDYKVSYDNHPLFTDGPKGRKQGSPVRIFTNVNPKFIELPKDEGYKFCKKCKKWVSEENSHCDKCNACTSKDGRTYIHCYICERCVKPTWKHCEDCERCTQIEHKCGTLQFTQECFHCKERGHKKNDCPKINGEVVESKKNLVVVEKKENVKATRRLKRKMVIAGMLDKKKFKQEMKGKKGNGDKKFKRKKKVSGAK